MLVLSNTAQKPVILQAVRTLPVRVRGVPKLLQKGNTKVGYLEKKTTMLTKHFEVTAIKDLVGAFPSSEDFSYTLV